MNPLTQLVATLRSELGITNSTDAGSNENIAELERVVMEGAVSTFLATEGVLTASTFVDWVEHNETNPDLMTAVFETFPTLLPIVQAELQSVIDATKQTVLGE